MRYISILLFLFSLPAIASDETSVRLVKIFSDGKQFVVQKSENISKDKEVFFRTKQMKSARKGIIKVCKSKTCLGTVEAGKFELNPAEIQNYKVSTKSERLKNKSLYLGYGSPLGIAVRAGLRSLNQKFLNYGVLFSRINSKSGSTHLTANAISFQGFKEIYQAGDFRFNLAAELGWAFSQLEFENSVDKREVKVNVYMAAASIETIYRFQNFGVSLNLGISKSGFKDKYSAVNGEFKNPYGKALVFSEIGVHYLF
jgi:hypothetical protein